MSRMNERRVKQIIGIAWCGAFILASFIIYGTNASKNNSKNCSIWGLHYEYSIALLVAGYVLPVSFLVFANGKVLFIARTHLNKIHAQEFSLSTLSEASCGPTTRSKQMPSKSRIRREIRIFKTFLIVTCAFLISWTPFVVILLIDSIFNVPELIRHSSIILLYCNSALNPFIYGFYNAEFRKALSESLGCKWFDIYIELMLFERRNSIGNQLSPFNMLEFTTFVLLRVFTLIETICPKFWAKPQVAQEWK